MLGVVPAAVAAHRLLDRLSVTQYDWINDKPNAAFGRNQTVLLEGRAPSRPLAPGTRPRRSVALQTTRQHPRKTRACSAI